MERWGGTLGEWLRSDSPALEYVPHITAFRSTRVAAPRPKPSARLVHDYMISRRDLRGSLP